MSGRRFRLRGDRTAQENLWEAVHIAASYFLVKMRGRVNLTRDEWNELFDELKLRTVMHFLENKVRQKKYCRKVSFISNVYSSCWSVSYRVLDSYLATVRHKIAKLNDEWMTTTLPKYTTRADCRASSVRNLKAWLKRSVNPPFTDAEDFDDAMTYIECCEECGIPVNEKSRMFRRLYDVAVPGIQIVPGSSNLSSV